jgi:O-succinylhomoserine sulfhydrylase
MAAIFGTFMTFLKAGDHLISCSSIFGSTHSLITKYLVRWGITFTYADVTQPDTWESLIRPNTRMIFLETPTNPGLDIIDLEWVSALARRAGVLLVVDNCFATPIGQTPIAYGADLVIHSATKWMDGQGRVLGGVVVGRDELIKDIYLLCRTTGPALSPFNAWVLSKSLETLEVRMDRHASSALSIAQALSGHPLLNWVRYPFLPSHPQYEIARRQMTNGGGVLCFELARGLAGGIRFLDSLELLSLTANLGDTRSIASHPASTTHAKLSEMERQAVGITPGLIRISVGLEHPDDIMTDILQALEQS